MLGMCQSGQVSAQSSHGQVGRQIWMAEVFSQPSNPTSIREDSAPAPGHSCALITPAACPLLAAHLLPRTLQLLMASSSLAATSRAPKLVFLGLIMLQHFGVHVYRLHCPPSR